MYYKHVWNQELNLIKILQTCFKKERKITLANSKSRKLYGTYFMFSISNKARN